MPDKSFNKNVERDPDGIFDYVIVGAGSTGSTLAGRLAENPQLKILVIEAGGSDLHPMIRMPIGYGKLFYDPKVNWRFQTEPEPALTGKPMYWPRGKVLGGSSSINAMVYVRGHPNDFNEWGAVAPGWSWKDLEPYFRKMENWKGGPDQARGGSGPLSVTDVSDKVHPLTNIYLKAASQLGFPVNTDYNSTDMEGANIYQTTTDKGFRASAYTAYLRPVKNQVNIQVLTNAHAKKILLKGKKAIGIEYSHKGKTKIVHTNREVILSAGALLSPQLLQLSGIGPAPLLQRHNVEVLHHSPDVGQHLKDHLGIDHTLLVNQSSLNQTLRPVWGKIRVGLEYLLKQTGPLSMSVNQGGGFVKSDPSLTFPDLQLYFSPLSYTVAPHGKRPMMSPDPFAAVRLGFNPCKPTSQGSIEIKSNDAFVAPKFFGNYLSTDYDLEMMLKGMRLMRKFTQTPALKEIVTKEHSPGQTVQSDAEMIAFARQNAGTVFHQCGTCRMGKDPSSSVVDQNLRVHGVEGLRVADASVFPTIPSGNINAAAILVGEKAAAILQEEA